MAVDERPYETFETSDFLPFQAGIQAGADAVLVSHNIVTSMDGSLPASLSPAVHQILRDTLGFDGVILTDDLAMDAVAQYAQDGSAAVLAVQAGNDMVLTTDFETPRSSPPWRTGPSPWSRSTSRWPGSSPGSTTSACWAIKPRARSGNLSGRAFFLR